MSNDLISRKTIKARIDTIRDCWAISPYVSVDNMKLYSEAINVVLQAISDCPIAFDKEKVIEDLMDWKNDAEKLAAKYDEIGDIDNMQLQDISAKCYETAIEIIEKGGIE